MLDNKYEGWTNYATWYINLQIINDQKLLKLVQELLKGGVLEPDEFKLFCDKHIPVPSNVMECSIHSGIVYGEICVELESYFNQCDLTFENITVNELTIISKASIDNYTVKLPSGQLDRNLYIKVNKILTLLGGKWNIKEQGHVFLGDPINKIEQLLLTGKINKPQKFDYFPTQPNIANFIVDIAKPKISDMILEPSVGLAHLAEAIARKVGKSNIRCVEIQEKYVQITREKGFIVQQADFLSITGQPYFDKIIMNPPFEKQSDIDHVLHAVSFLKPGGSITAIMSNSITFRENKKTLDFNKFLLSTKNNTCTALPPGSFKIYGTNVNTVVIHFNI